MSELIPPNNALFTDWIPTVRTAALHSSLLTCERNFSHTRSAQATKDLQ